jgi:hypothetical protein
LCTISINNFADLKFTKLKHNYIYFDASDLRHV